MVEKVIQLKCSCNEYPWGQKGSESFAARLCAKTPGTDFKIDENKPYSEMWMGTYPELPSYVLKTGEDLQDVLDANSTELIGRSIPKKFGHTKLPYLPKVLSIAKALPLQLHPNKSLAAELHSRDPSQFTDPNHKPEIALALSDFEAFVGFKPLKDIESLMQLAPLQPYMPLIKKPRFDDQTLKHVVKTMLMASDEDISKTTAALLNIPRDSFGEETYIPDMIPRLAEQYDQTDPGIIVALITMNYITLKPGQCIYIPADGIHAYLSGTIIECMARSNNVLNTGFCPRGDRNSAETFCSCLTFTPHAADEAILADEKFSKSKNGKTKLYSPPLSEFSILATELGDGEQEHIEAIEGPSIFICTQGEGMLEANGKSYEVKEGYIFFVGVGTEMDFVAKKGLQIFTAFAE
ncbi:mannose-6-phosphate isomeras-like protein [Mytilinidion resinicola]|uniref:Mannose-6-phosphate isomerase n=1 Tax=Mytilinidion resinicola TaxID=574789 RepID=A0A6A6Y5K9_9PEZI|nr:mannose-6-phosphate isomeras-like protein [Mytilinidion resinicola]KAF2803515.1 mannose-6-phosphate isomeras-like protein [Mytilinidion resinicola]